MTRALCDIESVSGNEKAIADAVEESLRGVAHLELFRDGDAIVARTMLTLTLSADHRAVDGATAAEFLRTLKGLLEEPAMMLA